MVLLSKVQVVALHGSDDRQSVSEVLRRVESVVTGMAKEYIEKEAAIRAATATSPMMPSQWIPIKHAIESIPAADVRENVVGEWKVHGYSAPCSNCGFDTGFGNTPLERLIKQFKFCPNCGAQMMGGAEDD